jgi:hypothetical protein
MDELIIISIIIRICVPILIYLLNRTYCPECGEWVKIYPPIRENILDEYNCLMDLYQCPECSYLWLM